MRIHGLGRTKTKPWRRSYVHRGSSKHGFEALKQSSVYPHSWNQDVPLQQAFPYHDLQQHTELDPDRDIHIAKIITQTSFTPHNYSLLISMPDHPCYIQSRYCMQQQRLTNVDTASHDTDTFTIIIAYLTKRWWCTVLHDPPAMGGIEPPMTVSATITVHCCDLWWTQQIRARILQKDACKNSFKTAHACLFLRSGTSVFFRVAYAMSGLSLHKN